VRHARYPAPIDHHLHSRKYDPAWPLALLERCGIPDERLFRADRDGRGARRDGRAERAAGAA